MPSSRTSNVEEFRAREKIPFFKKIAIDIGPDARTFRQSSLSINSSSITIQVPMSDRMVEHLPGIFRGDTKVHLEEDDILGRKRVILHHTRRFRAVLAKWIFSFTHSLGPRKIQQIKNLSSTHSPFR